MLAGLGHLLGREPPRLDRTGLPLARAGHALAHLVRLAVVVAGKAVALVLPTPRRQVKPTILAAGGSRDECQQIVRDRAMLGFSIRPLIAVLVHFPQACTGRLFIQPI